MGKILVTPSMCHPTDLLNDLIFVGAGHERWKVISCWEDGRRKRVPVSRCHGGKRMGECVWSIGIQFKRVGGLNLRKSRISRK